ncbi:MAG: hypothetical protein HYT50_01260 [Candidatus Wildermuthbacteria bacterium]|nr:hypothetical protein [Candidatus Wildermuthbacteria bacterium]
MRRYESEIDTGLAPLSLEMFLKDYNKNIPSGFPRASASILKKFQDLYPTLFKGGDTWTIAQHRKRVIDWLSSYRS